MASLLPHVATAYTRHLCRGDDYLGERRLYEFTPTLRFGLQLALVFEFAGRRGRVASLEAFRDYAQRIGPAHLPPAEAAVCEEALLGLGMAPGSEVSQAAQTVLQACHDLDLLRCCGRDKM